jgi:hypothetical protein
VAANGVATITADPDQLLIVCVAREIVKVVDTAAEAAKVDVAAAIALTVQLPVAV